MPFTFNIHIYPRYEVEKKSVVNKWTNEELSMYNIRESWMEYLEIKRKWKNEKLRQTNILTKQI